MSHETNLFIDVDGVLLGKDDPGSPTVVLAKHTLHFLDFATRSFNVFWLTTHCRGDASTVTEYLRPYAPDDVMKLAGLIRPTSFRTMKTEALVAPFFWLDDQPMASEIDWLENRGLRERWIEVNTRKRPDDLARAEKVLRTLARTAT